ncbi:MAG: MATE family efflux transporter, partial [Bacteroides fragilis]
MNDKYEERLGTDRMLPLVFRMALPAVIAQIVNLLYNIVDRIYIGHIPGIGTQALAGIGVAGSLIILISAFSAIVAGGGAPLAAIALGQGNRTHAGKILGNGFVLLLFFTLLTSGLSYLFMEPILLFTGASEQTLGYATAYLSIYLIGTLFVEVSVGLNTFINTQGRPGIAMLSIVIGALLNILLDPLFIFVFDWGVKGAALATIISQACSAGWVLFFLTSRRASLRLEPRYMRLDRKVVGAILALGASPFIMASTESLVGFVLNG